jgi:hypothetical protein
MVKGVFTGGFPGNKRFGRGVLVVKLWFSGGESWCLGRRFFGAKNMPNFSTIFLSGSSGLGFVACGAGLWRCG